MSQDFKYLGNNPGTENLPYLDNLDVEKTATNFNFSLWGASTKLYLKHVNASWNADYQNVVQFNSITDRDNYFKTNPPIILETEFRINHDGMVRLPIPYDNMINYNYILAEYPDAPIPGYESSSARKQYFYFIKDCKYIAPNTTELIIELDIWTSYLNDIKINNMQLERGHYPMTLNNVDSYLKNPLLNRIGLDSIDVNFGELCKISNDHQYNIYGDVFYLVATTSDPTSFTKEVTTYNGDSNNNWHKGLYYFSVSKDDWTSWVTNTMDKTPAFFQTIKGILIMPKTLFSQNNSFLFNGVTCYSGIENAFNIDYEFTKDDFGYDDKYKWLTKLYTAPYSVVEVLDFNGNKQQIPFEDLYVGKFAMQLFFNIAISNPTARAIVLNINGSNNNGDFNQVGVDISLPDMSVNLSPNKKYMFETEFPREQEQAAIDNSYNNSILSTKTSKTIGDANANLASTIAKRGNDQSKDFTTHDISADESILNRNISLKRTISSLQMRLGIGTQACLNLNNENTSYEAKGSGALAQLAGTVGGISSDSKGLIDGTINAGYSAISQGYNWTIASTMWSIVQNQIKYSLNENVLLQSLLNGLDSDTTKDMFDFTSVDGSIGLDDSTWNEMKNNSNGLINDANNDIFNTNKSNSEYKRDEGFSNSESNRTESLSRALGNNTLSSDTSNTISANGKTLGEAGIQRSINQSFMNDNATYGSYGDHSKFVDGLMSLHYHIKTQSPDAIRLAGDYFLRYGYSFNGNCQFSTFNIMKYFTFWKCQEVWIGSNNINANIASKFKNILEEGVTVWRDPDNIGNVSIYDNTL